MTGAQASPRWTLIASILGLSVTILDETVVFIALPAMERDLGFGLSGQQWVVNAYLLPLAALLLFGGSLADRYGRRRLFLIGLVVFGAASVAAGLAPTGATLIGARFVQGVGAAMLMPTTLALVTATFSGEERGAAIGSWASWSGAAAAVGPLVAGLAIDALSWRWVFLLQLPLVMVAVGIGLRRVEESRDPEAIDQPLDLLGAALAAVAVAGLAFALAHGASGNGWTSQRVLLSAVVAVTGSTGFLLREARARNPMLPLGLFRPRNFSAGNGTTLAIYAVFSGNFFVLTIYLQTLLEYSALQAGGATLPVTLLMITLSSKIGRLSERFGTRVPMTLGPLLAAGGFVWLALLEPDDRYWTGVLPGVVLFGLGLATTVAPLTTTVMDAVSEQQAGIASGVNNAVARTAGLIGVALIGAVFAAAFRLALPDTGLTARDAELLIAARDAPSSAITELPEDASDELVEGVRSASVQAYRGAMVAGALVSALGAAVSFAGVRDPRRPGKPSPAPRTAGSA